MKIPEKQLDKNYFTKFKSFLKKYFGISIPEWHSLVLGATSAIIAGPTFFTAIITAALALKKKAGHLYDLKKELGYGTTAFCIVEYSPEVLEWVLLMI